MTKKQYYEQEMVCFRFITEGCHVDNEIMTRKQADTLNDTYRQFNRPSVWVEYKEPQHIKIYLEQEFARLQQAVNH
jgi:hypothetical protein